MCAPTIISTSPLPLNTARCFLKAEQWTPVTPLIPRSKDRRLSRPLRSASHAPVPCSLITELPSPVPHLVVGLLVAQVTRLPVKVVAQDEVVGGRYRAVHVARTGVELPKPGSRVHQSSLLDVGEVRVYTPISHPPCHPSSAAPSPGPTNSGGVGS